MDLQRLQSILANVLFLDRSFRVLEKGDGFLIQVTYAEPDVDTGEMAEQHGRKWYVSSHATETEVVETAFAAVQRSMMHVVGEHFTYKGRRVYSPHFHVGTRIEMCDERAFDVRKPPETEAPHRRARCALGAECTHPDCEEG